MTALTIEAVSHSVGQVGQRRALFTDLSFGLEAGRVLALVGPNGAGKSTLLRIMAGLATADRGSVVLGGRDLASVPIRARARRLAYLPQATHLYEDLRVDDLVLLGRSPWLGRFAAPSALDRDRVASALAAADLGDFAGRWLSTLSAGERQRAMLARMLATEAEVLLLDEPTTALDLKHAVELMKLLRHRADAGHAVAVVLHDLGHARLFADEVLCLEATETGSWRLGSSAQVLTEATLRAIFGVHAVVRDDGGVGLLDPALASRVRGP